MSRELALGVWRLFQFSRLGPRAHTSCAFYFFCYPPLPTPCLFFPSQHLASFPSYSFSFPSSLSPPQPPTPLNQSPIFSSLSGPSVKPRVIAFLHSCKSARLIFFISSRSLVTFFPVASLPGCPGNSSRLRRSFKLTTPEKSSFYVERKKPSRGKKS